MNAWLVLCNKKTDFSYIQCTPFDKTSQTTATDSRRYQRVVSFKTKSPNYGNGFIVSPQLKNNVHKYWYMSGRVTVLQIKLSNTEKRANSIKETS